MLLHTSVSYQWHHCNMEVHSKLFGHLFSMCPWDLCNWIRDQDKKHCMIRSWSTHFFLVPYLPRGIDLGTLQNNAMWSTNSCACKFWVQSRTFLHCIMKSDELHFWKQNFSSFFWRLHHAPSSQVRSGDTVACVLLLGWLVALGKASRTVACSHHGQAWWTEGTYILGATRACVVFEPRYHAKI